ncbi:MAG: hypothetical protein JRJ39_00095 [Deltaproteobacteria bacterium]|nr:hypothetical protein [Deltaproteobacteria bacterium]
MPKKLKKNKQLQKKAEKLWKEIIRLRDGDVCMVEKHFKRIKTKHTKIYQADHCFSRGFKRLFLEISNGTLVCSSCNLNKNYNDAIRLAVYDIVREREGEDIFNRMREQKEQGGAFLEWGKIGWLEDKIKVLEEIKELYEQGVL